MMRAVLNSPTDIQPANCAIAATIGIDTAEIVSKDVSGDLVEFACILFDEARKAFFIRAFDSR